MEQQQQQGKTAEACGARAREREEQGSERKGREAGCGDGSKDKEGKETRESQQEQHEQHGPHFDHIPSAGLGEYNNDCQTFYEATADIHLWAKEEIVCYVDDLEIIEDHFATKEGEDDGQEMWVDEGDDVCVLRGGYGISADYGPNKGKSWGWAMKRTRTYESSQPETDGGSSG
jgi:hypothetical protein